MPCYSFEATSRAERGFKPRPEGPCGKLVPSNRHELGLVLGDKSQGLGEAQAPGARRPIGLGSEKDVRWSTAGQTDL